MQAVVSVSCLGDKSLLHANEHCTYTTALFRFSCLLTNKGIAQCIDNSNSPFYVRYIYIYIYIYIYHSIYILFIMKYYTHISIP